MSMHANRGFGPNAHATPAMAKRTRSPNLDMNSSKVVSLSSAVGNPKISISPSCVQKARMTLWRALSRNRPLLVALFLPLSSSAITTLALAGCLAFRRPVTFGRSRQIASCLQQMDGEPASMTRGQGRFGVNGRYFAFASFSRFFFSCFETYSD